MIKKTNVKRLDFGIAPCDLTRKILVSIGAAQAVGHIASLDPGPVVHRKRKWNPIGFAQLMLLDICVLSAMQRLIYVLYPKYISSTSLRVKIATSLSLKTWIMES